MQRLLPLFLGILCLAAALPTHAALPATGLFSRTNLVAWCIVPFDSQKRGPEERAAMLERLGIHRLAYDWRSEHIPTFDAEVAALQKRHIELVAWWFPSDLNHEAKAILACIERHRLHPQLWITMGTEPESDPVRLQNRIRAAATTLGPICTAAARLGCTVGLYNHLGWFGEPTNQVAVLQALRAAGHTNVGSVYNFHHGHGHIDTFASELQTLKPHLLAVNLNGMTWEGDHAGKKILPLGEGEEELRMMQILQGSGWRGPVGILGHTDEDAEVKLRKELAGLEKLASRLHEAPAAPPKRTTRRRNEVVSTAAKLPPAGAAVLSVDDQPTLDARVRGAVADGQPWFRQSDLPIEINVRARLDRPDSWNILVASEAKSSPTHWELYTFAGTGDLSFYAPGMTPDTIRSGVNLCDGQWHSVGAVLDDKEIRLTVDGREVARQNVQRRVSPDDKAAQIGLGRLVEGGLGCDGQIQVVDLRRNRATASTEAHLVALALREPKALKTPPAGGTKSSPGSSTARSSGEPASSGREPASQVEKDWADNRWQETDIGPFLASNLGLSDGSTLAKGLTVKVGAEGAGAMAYDTATGAMRAAWTGGFLKFDPMRFGLIGTIHPAQPERFTAMGPGTPSQGSYRFHGIHQGQGGTVLDYEIDGVRILEHPELRDSPAGPVFVRNLHVAPHDRSLSFLASGHLKGTNTHTHSFSDVRERVGTHPSRVDWLLAQGDEGNTASAVGVVGAMKIQENHLEWVGNGGRLQVLLAPETRPVVFSLLLWRGSKDRTNAFRDFVSQANPGTDPEKVAQAGPSRWPTLNTRGQRGADTDFLAVDTLTLPYDNPEKALLFGSGIDFTPDGAGYLCTIHGDVWRVTGIDDALQNLKWTRYATGLFQPLGLKVRDGKVFVLGRDRITRLHDLNQDGEADRYENFHDGIQTSTGGHDYVTCLERDAAGRFYYVDPIGVHRVSADGRSSETLATGFRNPNGMGASPDGSVVTAAPQQGTWTPTSFIAEIRPGGYYGYGGPKVTPERPLGYDAPLCWIPHPVDNSSGSQVWVPKGQWGPLGGQMLHLLWGRCGMMLALRDAEPGQPARQGAVVPLPAKFLSGPNRGTFHPDGSLFVAGSTGWQTSAVKDGALQRVRFTGKRTALPIGFRVVPNGVAVTFSQPLDRRTAEDPGSYGLKQWNYRYAEAYGSKDWSVKDPNREGRDDVEVKSARLEPDGRTVVLEIPGLGPVMQAELKYNVDAAEGGKPLKGQFWFTVNPR
jgi:Concanavalin A-like lectin/glucanases superfamily